MANLEHGRTSDTGAPDQVRCKRSLFEVSKFCLLLLLVTSSLKLPVIAMLVLGIDTATRIASVGLVSNGEVLDEESSLAVSNHTETLLPLILQVLERSQLTLAAVQGIGVSIGPGSFTGLRIALGTVKGFAYAQKQLVVGVSTLEALAQTVPEWEGDICTVLDARKGEVYAAFFHCNPAGQYTRLSPDQVVSPQTFFTERQTPCLFLGDGVERYGDLLIRQCGPYTRLLPFPTHHPRGGVIAQMAWRRLSRGEHDDVGLLTPHYVRKPEAEFKRIV
jgi:tRNA threonylcarbamoyladenosine biosynthesis protein TsaB